MKCHIAYPFSLFRGFHPVSPGKKKRKGETETNYYCKQRPELTYFFKAVHLVLGLVGTRKIQNTKASKKKVLDKHLFFVSDT